MNRVLPVLPGPMGLAEDRRQARVQVTGNALAGCERLGAGRRS